LSGPPLTRTKVLLIIDHQVGLYQLVRDFDHTVYYNNIMAHAELGKLFNLPVVMTTSAEQGPNGPLPEAILDLYPNAPLIRRQGEVK
jgi:nicotinamidase-related amidase